MAIVSVPKVLRNKLGDDGAEALIRFFNDMQAANSQKEEIIEIVEEKFERRLSEELGKLRVEIAEMKAELRNEMAQMRSELRDEMATMSSKFHDEIGNTKSELGAGMIKIKSELREEMGEMNANLLAKIAQSQADLIKWMFIFWVGQIGVLVGILFAFFK